LIIIIEGENLNPARRNEIVEYAKTLGPADVRWLPAEDIPVDPRLADLCGGGRCPGYGQSMSCPPNVMHPDAFIETLSGYAYAVVFKFDVPTGVLMGDERHEVNRLVHETAASIERFALENGWRRVRGYAAGSCRRIFCREHPGCRAIENGSCRHPDAARPSMSGMGIHFLELCRRIGWPMARITRDTSPDDTPMGMLAGMVLIG
jgi:predicted metal-binding protein